MKLRKKQPSRLSRLQFFSIVAGVVLAITLIGLAINRRQNSPPPKAVSSAPTNIPQTKNTPVSSSPIPVSPLNTLPPLQQTNVELTYNIPIYPNFQKSQKLQSIVDRAVSLATDKKLPNKALSITLIDAKTGKYGAYQQDELRYPASIVKMFWMVYSYSLIQKNPLREADFTRYLNKMIKNSDNDSASYVVDTITGTESGNDFQGEEYENWLQKRNQLNKYFQQAGYTNINLNQKVFPINYLNISEPQGAELKMRGNPEKPIRNKMTTQHAARLLYEIYDGQAISPDYSGKMINLLRIDSQTRNLKKDDQNPNEFNPVRGFFSEPLPSNIDFGGKAGWTSNTRQEAAYIATPDGKAAYILVVFAEDRAYAYDWKIFPQISSMIFERMTNGK
ncbi:serine hydrolase [Hassallia byssoidea VB512170]|uniref:Serine hydrolase n=2 Tax=Hassallia TaxID=482629 RepID=A0A846HE40_9CYAN|nr:serine hydrolase [Hassalia byssoidea]NEU75817.1 serine hydrolase [Hassalia byssoidea VB512170]